eukprot:3269703-Rhodomonas_salina.2
MHGYGVFTRLGPSPKTNASLRADLSILWLRELSKHDHMATSACVLSPLYSPEFGVSVLYTREQRTGWSRDPAQSVVCALCIFPSLGSEYLYQDYSQSEKNTSSREQLTDELARSAVY